MESVRKWQSHVQKISELVKFCFLLVVDHLKSRGMIGAGGSNYEVDGMIMVTAVDAFNNPVLA